MPAAYQGLSDVQVQGAIALLKAAASRVQGIIASKQTPAGVSATDYDLVVAAQLKGAIEKELSALESALLKHAGKTAVAASTVAAKDYSTDVAKHGIGGVGISTRTIAFAADVSGEKIRNVSAQVKGNVRTAITMAMAGGLSRAELVEKVSDAVAGQRTAAGVERIVRTEVATAYEQSQVAADAEILAAGGDLIKVWHAVQDGRTRDDHFAIDGQERELDESFDLGGGATAATPPGGGEFHATAPNDPRLPAEQAVHCRCWVERVPRDARQQPYTKAERPVQGPEEPTAPRESPPRAAGQAPPEATPAPREAPPPPVPEPAPIEAPPPPPLADVSPADLAAAEALAVQANALGAGGTPPSATATPATPPAAPPGPVSVSTTVPATAGAAAATAPAGGPTAPAAPPAKVTKTPAAPGIAAAHPPGTLLVGPKGKSGVVVSIAPSGISGTVKWADGKTSSVYGTQIQKWAAKAKGPPPPPAAPPPAPVPQTATAPDETLPAGEPILDAREWKKIGPQKGSNPGGLFTDADGVRWYVKAPPMEPAEALKRVLNEKLAAKLYSLAGVTVPDVRMVRTNLGGKDRIGIASRWVDGVESGQVLSPDTPGLFDGYGADVWLANHDVAGLGFDNIGVVNGKAIRLDVGGALLYRAQGLPKWGFGPKVAELSTMRDPSKNSQAAELFGPMTWQEEAASLKRVSFVSDSDIRNAVLTYGHGSKSEREHLAAILIARKDAIDDHSFAMVKAAQASAAAAAAPVAPAAPAVVPPAPVEKPWALPKGTKFVSASDAAAGISDGYTLVGTKDTVGSLLVELEAPSGAKVFFSKAEMKTLAGSGVIIPPGKRLPVPKAAVAPDAPPPPAPPAPPPAPAAPPAGAPDDLKVGDVYYPSGAKGVTATVIELHPGTAVVSFSDGLVAEYGKDVIKKQVAKSKATTPAAGPTEWIPPAGLHAPDPAGPKLYLGAAVVNAKGKVGKITSLSDGKTTATITYIDGKKGSMFVDKIQPMVGKAIANGVTSPTITATAAPKPKAAVAPPADDVPVPTGPAPWGAKPADLAELPPHAPPETLETAVSASKKTFDSVKTGSGPKVGIDYTGSGVEKANAAGWWTSHVKTPSGSYVKVYAATAADAKHVVAYLKAGGQVGTPQLSALLGYTPQQVADYKALLLKKGKSSLANAAPIPLPEAPPVPKKEVGSTVAGASVASDTPTDFVHPTTGDPRTSDGRPWARPVGETLREVAHVEHGSQIIASASAGEREALRSYTASGYRSINEGLWSVPETRAVLRTPNGPPARAPKDSVEKKRANLQEMLLRVPKLPEPVIVYRGIAHQGEGDRNDMVRRLGLDQGVGAEVELHGFQSASTNTGTPAGLGAKHDNRAGVLLEISTRRGASVRRHSATGASEDEWLLPSGLRYRIVGYERNVKIESMHQRFDVIKLETID